MTRTSKTLKRLCVSGLAVVTIGAGVPVLVATAAQAKTDSGPITTVALAQGSPTVAATNCAPFAATVTDQTGSPTVGATVTVRVALPAGTTSGTQQTIRECTINATTGVATDSNNTTSPYSPLIAGSAITDNGTILITTKTNAQGVANFGLSAENATNYTVQAFFDANKDGQLTSGEPASSVVTENVVVNRFNDSVRTITASNLATPTVQVGGSDSDYLVTLTDANGVPLNNVKPANVRYFVSSGPGARLATDPTTADCANAPSNSRGQMVCTVAQVPATDKNTGDKPTTSGTQTITFFVDQTQGTAVPDQKFTTGEPSTTATRQVTGLTASATTVAVSPNGQTFPGASQINYTATVTDANGNPVQGVTVRFTKSGAGGNFTGNSNTITATSVANGTAVVTVGAGSFNDLGAQTVNAVLEGPTACPGTATTAGRAATCSATATNTLSNSGATSPSPSTSASPSPSTSVSPSPSATGTPSASPTTQAPRLGISVSPSTITPGIASVVTITGRPGTIIELQAYSRPNTTYGVVRRGTILENGTLVFRVVPGTNTRLFAAVTGQTGNESPSVVINVRTALSLTVVRNGSLDYTFQGRILPRRAGQLITLYRVTNSGQEIITSQIKTDNTGTYFIRRVFTGQGTFGFLTRTGQTLTNASGVSNDGQARPTAIYAGPQR